MATPTIQLGNGNWAGKSENLLGFYIQNGRFYKQEFTFSRSTSGTRVNSSGLIETAEILGNELVTNGDFSTDTDWSKGAGWSIVNGEAVHTGSGNYIEQGSLIQGKNYKVIIVVTQASGSGFPQIYMGGLSTAMTSPNTYTFYITAQSGDKIKLRGINDCKVDSISVKEVDYLNMPRVDYLNNSNGSLILEPQRSNLLNYSTDFTQWGNARTTDTSNQITSPNGLNEGTLLEQQSGQTNAGSIYLGGLSLSSGTYTQSIFAKKNDKNFIVCYNANAERTYFNLSNGTIGTVASGNTAKIEDYGNGWYRCATTYTLTSGSIAAFYLADTDNSTVVTDSGGVYIYGAQLEAGSYPTTLINTSGSSVTRNADGCELTNASDSIGQTEGTIYVSFKYRAFSEDMRMGITDGSSANYNLIRITSGGTMYVLGSTSSSLQYEINCGALTDGDNYRVALRYKENDINIFVNGVSKGTDTSANVGACNRFGFDNRSIGANPFYSDINQLSIYDTALTDQELAELTGGTLTVYNWIDNSSNRIINENGDTIIFT